VQSSTSGSTELAASAEQMSKMSRELLDSMDRFSLRGNDVPRMSEKAKQGARHAAAGSQS